MNKPLILFLSLIILFSCNTKQDNQVSETAASVRQDTLAPLQETVVADLHDSLQPKTMYLDKMPAANVAQAGKAETKPLAVLQNDKGEPILDPSGNPFIMGDGGKSNFTNFTTDNGLALDAISCSVMDKTGNLWFGTQGGGVSKYDGKSFTNYSTAQGLANNVVFSILEDKTGNLWFGTNGGGVSKYDGKSFTNYSTAQGLANNVVLSILEDKTGNLWFGTGGGVSKYDPSASLRTGGKSFTNYSTVQGLANNGVLSILEDKTGNLWFGTLGGGVSKYDGKSFTNYSTAQGLAHTWVWSIFEDKTGNIWFGTGGGGLSKYDPSASLRTAGKSFTNYSTAQGLANNVVWSILEDKTGNLWFGTNGGGACKYDGKSFTNYSTAQGLAHNGVLSILEDKTGNLWFGTYGGGLSKYDGKSFKNYSTTQGLAHNVAYSILEDKTGNLWFGTNGGGVSKYDGKSFTNYSTAQGLANNVVRSILEDKKGNLWFGTNGGGVSKYDGKSFTNYSTAQGLANNGVLSILEDKTGNLWFGTLGGGVSKYDGKSFTNYSTAQGFANNMVSSILEDKTGNLWFGTRGGGVSKYNGKSFTNYTTAQGLANNYVWSMLEDKAGNLWFGTAEGLSVMSGGVGKNLSKKSHNEGKRFTSFKIADGLPDNFVTQVNQMPNGKMGVSTNLGITIFNVNEDYTKLTDIEIFNSNTGYPVKDVNIGQNSMYLDSKGVIWAGTGSEKTALVRFDYAALHKSKEPPALVIQSVKVKDENICWFNLQTKGIRKNAEDSASALLQEFSAFGKTLTTSENDAILKRFGSIQFDGITPFYPLPQNLVLPYEHNQIAFDFAAIETDRPFLVKYQYMLEGYDKDWSPVTDKSNANFGNINEGTYTFKLKAQGANGVWCEPITYTFQVLPPWYRTWWAYVIYLLSFIAILYLFIKWREGQLRAEKEMLERTVKERTVEVEKQKEELVQKNIVIEKEKLEADKQREEADKQRQRSDDLLLNILPEEVAEELKEKGHSDAQLIDHVTVLFTDFKGFTALSEKVTPKELVEDLHECFSAFDRICDKYGIEKIKTIGDAYMAAGGLPVPNTTHAQDVVKAALEMAQVIEKGKAKKIDLGLPFFEIRIGVHTGPVVAGIVGVKKFQYDIWGDTVNTASRMESSGEVGKVNISDSTYELVKDKFTCTHRGKVAAKGKGEIDMYFVEGRI